MPSFHHTQQRFNQALAIAQQQGITLTALRKVTLAHILQAQKPIGAYELLKKLQSNYPKMTAMSVYRTLHFLKQNHFIHKIESNNTFLACMHLGETHIPQFLICEHCQQTQEILYSPPKQAAQAASKPFKINHYVIELKGICHLCQQ